MFVRNGNLRLPIPLESEKKAARVILIGPADMPPHELASLERALTELGAHVHTFRTDETYDFGKVRALIPKATHVLLVLDREDHEHASRVLLSTDAAGTAKVGFICYHTDEALKHFASRIRDRAVDIIVVTTYAEHARVRTMYGRSTHHIVVATDLLRSSNDIARSFVGSLREAQTAR